eukprot:CAMPEP_0178427434 /NCGR_PEP_ID=MMETSP0689_2-20121128/29745_1 /TAXON_ID=160604 /ORGANISM="Amphidinium massartii, Strain CS-259" /LENGTH=337 /DNA_ID=CAMNT_0020049145 /DNA_START=54 /DNA_END=1068 /DNA_ORIENTATION=+
MASLAGCPWSFPHVQQDFPANLRDGIDNLFGFASLEDDALNVKRASEDALEECNEVARVACNPIVIDRNDMSEFSDTTGSIRKIRMAFNNSLSIVQQVTNDKYLGTDELRDAANQLNVIDDSLQEVERLLVNGSVPCQSVKEAYCEMYNNADRLKDGVAEVNQELDRWTDGDAVSRWEEWADYMVAFHGGPYFMVLGALCFFCVWWKDGRCCATKFGSCCSILFAIFWLIFFAVQTVITAVCVVVVNGQDQVEQRPPEMGEPVPTVEDVINHIKETYPEFWNTVFTDMEDGLVVFYYAALAFEVFAILIMVFAYGLCCCSPYPKADEEKQQNARGTA